MLWVLIRSATYPPIQDLYTFIYWETKVRNQMFVIVFLDYHKLSLDKAIASAFKGIVCTFMADNSVKIVNFASFLKRGLL